MMERTYLSIYNNGIMLEEPIVFFEEDGMTFANLSEEPSRIVKIHNPITGEILTSDDFEVEGTTLKLKNKKVNSLRKEWLLSKNIPGHIKNAGAEYKIFDILLMEPAQLASFQYRVTYNTLQKPLFPQTVYFLQALSCVREKARQGKKVKIILYGDSISNAANSSGEGNFAPFEETWYNKAIGNMRAYFKNENITLFNRSRSGFGSQWGAENAQENIEEADLLIVAFGMNDATDNLNCNLYMENIQKILQSRKNTDCDVVLVSSILPNPDSEFYRVLLRKEYGRELRKLCEKENYAFMDMLSVSAYYLKLKSYCEISGNNFNHPNDFIYQFYADALTKLLTANN